MIGVVFPPGCYGTFLSQCLYYFTGLGYSSYKDFVFDEDGSSHRFRANRQSKQVLWYGHSTSPGFDTILRSSDKLVMLLPQINHALDYFDNQFVKQEKKQIIKYLHNHYAPDIIDEKLCLCWQYEHGLDQHTPIWILREWASYWIGDVFSASYAEKNFDICKSATCLTTVDLFDNFNTTIVRVVDALGLELIAEQEKLDSIHNEFVSRQKFHLIQTRCETWIDHVLFGDYNVPSPCLTLFDEAYVQHLLRNRGYEIECDSLDAFPKSSDPLRKKIYRI